jgi:hypothetical protein
MQPVNMPLIQEALQIAAYLQHAVVAVFMVKNIQEITS